MKINWKRRHNTRPANSFTEYVVVADLTAQMDSVY